MAKAKASAGAKRPRARRDPDATKAALLNSAVTLFDTHGYDATSVQQIVEDAGRTKGAFYHYFESKEDLLRDLHDRFIDYGSRRRTPSSSATSPPTCSSRTSPSRS